MRSADMAVLAATVGLLLLGAGPKLHADDLTDDLALRQAMQAAARHDYAAAVQLWKPLAEQGNVMAEFDLGVSYATGAGSPQDYDAAVFWLRKAADAGFPNAQFVLGEMYRDGHGVPKSATQAATWYRLAADQGFGRAQFNLGVAYADGKGVPLDMVEAYRWFSLALVYLPSSEVVDRRAATNNLRGLDDFLSPAELKQARRLIADWQAHARLKR